MIRAVRSIVHGNSNVDQAFKLYKKLVSEESKNRPKNQNKSKGNTNQNKSKGNTNQNKSNPVKK